MENEIKDRWNEIITYMRDTYNINGVLFRTWINPLTIVSCDNDTIILAIDEKEQGDILGLIEKKNSKLLFKYPSKLLQIINWMSVLFIKMTWMRKEFLPIIKRKCWKKNIHS